MAESDSTPGESDSTRRHFEQGIAMAAPLLDLVLAVGERISRIAEPVDYEFYPVRDPDSGAEPGAEPGDESGEGRVPGDPPAL